MQELHRAARQVETEVCKASLIMNHAAVELERKSILSLKDASRQRNTRAYAGELKFSFSTNVF